MMTLPMAVPASCIKTAGKLRLPGIKTTGKLCLPGIFAEIIFVALGADE